MPPTSEPIPIRTDLAIRPAPTDQQGHSYTKSGTGQSRHKHTRSSYSESSPLVSRNNSLSFRPLKRSTPSPDKTIAPEDKLDVTANAHIPGISVNQDLISSLFRGAQLAFINTTFYGNELQIGEAIADTAKRAGVHHFIYSSMPDHAAYNPDWPSLPLWAAKHKVEEYIRKIELPATYVYTGIYNNNFTSLPYPLFCMELKPDGSFEWQAPFHPDAKLPWLDAEHDVGPAILQLFKDGPSKWNGKRIALAYEHLSPLEVCKAFEAGVGMPVRYKRGPIEVKVKIPEGYREQLVALEKLFSPHNEDPTEQPPYFGDIELERGCPDSALALWEGPRGLGEYAQEIFPLEEEANGMTWMFDEEEVQQPVNGHDYANGDYQDEAEDGDDDSIDEGLVMRGLKRDEEEWLA
ncbi:putative nitrogen metabolic regulation protein nmr [Apiospora aurea]|uniref:Nitrogen metabolic regulation protein nmr n=1 Tax=Apiospora aurea TaxID=335848 RepID=A0ABR1QYB5_9PEZI